MLRVDDLTERVVEASRSMRGTSAVGDSIVADIERRAHLVQQHGTCAFRRGPARI
jgi:hypothetical protein